MEIFNPNQKFDWTNVTDDYKKTQQIAGIAAAAGIILSVFVVFSSNIPAQNIQYIWYTILLAGVFTAVYYLVPSFYANRKFEFLPDLVFVLAISSLMLNMGQDGEFFFIFLMLIIAMNAFSMTRKLYLLSFFEIISALLLVHTMEGHITFHWIQKDVLFQFYGVISFGIILRLFATETISLRKKQDELQKRSRQLLAQKNEIYLLLDNISEGVIAVDTEKRITLINKGALKLLGIVGKKHLVGKNFDEILSTSTSEGKISAIDEALKLKKPVIRDDLKLVRHDKTLRLHTNAAPVIDEDRKLVGSIILFRDITAERVLEEQREEFNAIASHELRTPLTVIEGYLFYLLNDKKLKYDKKTAEYITKTYNAAEGLLHLSNDILTVVKTDNNEIKVFLEKTDTAKIIKECVEAFAEKAKSKKLKLTMTVQDDLPEIMTDQQKLREVISNLTENALKFTDKGQITIEALVKDKDEVLICVKDTGVGVSKEDQTMLFHKFYRVEDWQTRKTGGTGLGLYIVKSYIQRLGGRIGIESKKGHGSNFWFTLPISGKITKKKKNVSDEQLNDFIKSI